MAGGGLASPFKFTGAGGYPGVNGNCGATLAPSASCTIEVAFEPTLVGLQTDTIEIYYNNGSTTDQANRDIQGTGATPATLTFTPASTYDYGVQAIGSSTQFTFTVTNTGSISATSITDTGLSSANFQYAGGTYPGGGTCGTTLAGSGASCTIIVEYNPTTVGPHNDTISFSYFNGVSTVSTSLPVTGTGANPANIIITSGEPDPYDFQADFGILAFGATATHQLTIQNIGGVPATAFTLSGLSAPYNISATTCGDPLNAGASCTIDITYAPTSTGPHTDTLQINYNNGVSAQVFTEGVAGNAAAPAQLTISEVEPYDFGTVPLGAIVPHVFTIQNTGGVAATSLSGAGLTSSDFRYESTGSYPGSTGTCSGSLPAGSSCTVVVEFLPQSTGTKSDTLTINYDDGVGATSVSRGLTGTGANPALLSLSDGPSYDYGSIARNGYLDHIFTVSNLGGVDATSISPVAFSSTEFDFAGGSYPGLGGNCGSTLAAGASCDIVVRFSSSTNGVFSDTLQINYNDGVSAQSASRPIGGVVTDPALLTYTPNPQDYGTVARGSTSVATIQVDNTGGVSA
ncbi:MAG: choice-of-anchor D domain-containing protein, partial [Bdellovibrio sp.]